MSVRVLATTALGLPAAEVDLAAWLTTLTDADYQATSRAHLGLGHRVPPDRPGVTAVEALGGAFIVNHHHVESLAPHAFRLRSPRSRAYGLRLVPIRLDLTWELWLEADGRLACALEVALPGGLERVAAAPLSAILQRHADEETAGFARDLRRKSSA